MSNFELIKSGCVFFFFLKHSLTLDLCRSFFPGDIKATATGFSLLCLGFMPSKEYTGLYFNRIFSDVCKRTPSFGLYSSSLGPISRRWVGFFITCETCMAHDPLDNYGVSVTLELSGFLVYQISQKPVLVTAITLLNCFWCFFWVAENYNWRVSFVQYL